MCVGVCVYVLMYARVGVCMYLRMYVWMYVCMPMYLCIGHREAQKRIDTRSLNVASCVKWI